MGDKDGHDVDDVDDLNEDEENQLGQELIDLTICLRDDVVNFYRQGLSLGLVPSVSQDDLEGDGKSNMNENTSPKSTTTHTVVFPSQETSSPASYETNVTSLNPNVLSWYPILSKLHATAYDNINTMRCLFRQD